MSFKYEITQERNNPDNKYIVIKGFEGSCRSLVIPEGFDEEPGLYVKEIGNHAFSSRKDLTEVSIPETVETILGFAFHNCGNLKKISLTDSVTEYLDGGTRQCESLEEIEVYQKKGNNYIIRRILEDNDRRLTFRLHNPDGDVLLVFPGFNYDFVENTMARTIQFAIEGTGYAYRECVKADRINYREYDNMFSKASADDAVTAEMIAIARLSVPYELSEEAKATYENWLLNNAGENLKRVLTEPLAAERAEFYIKRKLIKQEDAGMLSHRASECGLTEIVSMLMDYGNQEADKGNEDDMMLELDF